MINNNYPTDAATIIRLLSFLTCASLFAASLVLIMTAPTLDRPFPQFAIAALTFVLTLSTFYGANVSLHQKKSRGIFVLTATVIILILLPTIRFVPGIFRAAYLMDLEALFPPMWIYCAAIPLLFFTLLELTMKGRNATATPLMALVFPVLAATSIIFTGSTLIGILTVGLFENPFLIFIGFLAPVALAAFIAFGAVIARKGMLIEGGLLLVVVGLLIEWISIMFYMTIPDFIAENVASIWQFTIFDNLLPILPILGGTIPGAFTALSGLLLLKHFRDRKSDYLLGTSDISLVDWLQQNARNLYSRTDTQP